MREEELLPFIKDFVRTRCDGCQQRLADASGCSKAYVSDVLRGNRPPGKKILDAVGLEKIVDYRVKE